MHTASTPPHAPAWRAWLIWGVAVAAYVIAVANRASLSAVGVDTAERFQADGSVLALFAVIQLAVYGGMQVPIGLLLDRFGARPLIVIGMLLMAVGQFTMALSADIGIALLARVLLGAGDAAIFPSVLRLIAVWFPAQQAPMLVQMTGIIGQGGQILAVIPLAALLLSTSWTIAFASLASLGVLFTILTWLIIRNRPPQFTQDVSVNTETGVIQVITSTIDTSTGLRAALTHPGTRLAFWSHFATPFAGSAFILLWGTPYLTAGEGLSTPQAAGLLTFYVLVGMVVGPLLGALSRRFPNQRAVGLILPAVLIQAIAWLAVILWPGPAPFWLLITLMVALATGGPASMIAFDQARTYNPAHRLSTATGVVNSGGFVAALLAVFLIGMVLDLQGAGTPATYTLEAFRSAFLVQLPLWFIGAVFILIERKKTRRRIGLDR